MCTKASLDRQYQAALLWLQFHDSAKKAGKLARRCRDNFIEPHAAVLYARHQAVDGEKGKDAVSSQ